MLSGLLPDDRSPVRQQLRDLKMRGVRRRGSALLPRGSFDLGRTTDFNKNHWARADSLSPNAAASSSVRKTVRERARYETANNCYVVGMANTFSDWCVGTGPELQLVIQDDSEAARRIERRFREWAKAIQLGRKLWTARRAQTIDGEAFAIEVTNDRLVSEIKLDYKLVECDQIATPDTLGTETSGRAVDGIVFDDANNPVEYHLLKHHPGNAYGGSMFDYERIDASHVIHLFRVDRPGQQRGVSEIMPALPLFAQLRRYTNAVIGAAEAAADIAFFLYTEAAANEGIDDEAEAFSEIEFTPRMITALPFGYKMAQMKAEQPTTAYKEFKGEIINEAARAISMPYNVAAGNSAGYNYASGRLDHQSFWRAIEVVRALYLEGSCLDFRVFPAWIEEDRRLHRDDYAAPLAAMTYSWMWPGMGHVDPAKEAQADDRRQKNLQLTLGRYYASQGRDYEAELTQADREQTLVLEQQVRRAKKIRELMKTEEVSDEDLARIADKPAGSVADQIGEIGTTVQDLEED